MACRCGRPAACVRKLTFTALINRYLYPTGLKINDLETDLDDGLVLIKLIETFSPGGRMPGRYYAAPKTQIQKIQNLSLVFRILVEVEKIQLNGITPGDILERNMEKTLELLWLLILHYHVDSRSQQNASEQVIIRKNVCKRSMLVWVNAILPGKRITNFTTDWSSGENLAALVNFCKPGLVGPQIHGLHAYQRIVAVIEIAYKELNVPQILTPDDLFVDQPDELAIMTYLSYFCRRDSPGERALLLWIQQQIPSQNITNLTTDWVTGINLGALVNKLTQNGFSQYEKFSSSTSVNNIRESMKKAEELLKIPSGGMTAESFSSDGLTYFARLAYLIQFYAVQKGDPVVMKVDVSKVQVSTINRGEEKGKKVVWIDVDCSNAGTAEIRATVTTDAGKNITVTVTTIDGMEDKYRVKFVVEASVHVYTLSITYGGQEVVGSPFHVHLGDPNAKKVKPLDREEVTEWVEEKQVVFGFDVRDAGFGKLTAKASGESAGFVPVQLVSKSQGGYEVIFVPPIPDVYNVDVKWGKFMAFAKGFSSGTIPIEFHQDSKKEFKLAFEPPSPDVYSVDLTFEGQHVPGSPFTINLLQPVSPEKVDIGDPMFGGEGENVDLLVDLTHAGPGTLTATCTGEKVGKVETTILIISKRLQQVSFVATEIDVYTLSIFFDGVHVKGSPFHIDLGQKRDNVVPQIAKPPVVKAFTMNLLSFGKARVSVDPIPDVLKCALGQALILQVSVSSEDGFIATATRTVWSLFTDIIKARAVGEKTGKVSIEVEKISSEVFDVIFKPTKSDRYAISIEYEGQEVLKQPFTAEFTEPENNPSKVVVGGVKGVDFYVNHEFKYVVKTAGAGIGPLRVKVEGPGIEGTQQIDVNEESSDRYIVRYLPSAIGKYLFYLFWGEEAIPGSPVMIEVKDLPVIPPGQPARFEIPAGKWKLSFIEAVGTHLDSGTRYKVQKKKQKDKFIFTIVPVEPGTYEIVLRVMGKNICQPFYFKFVRQSYPEKISIFDSITEGRVKESLLLKFDISEAGKGSLDFSPKKYAKKVRVRDGVYIIRFLAKKAGDYKLILTWNGVAIPCSPLLIKIRTVRPTPSPLPGGPIPGTADETDEEEGGEEDEEEGGKDEKTVQRPKEKQPDIDRPNGTGEESQQEKETPEDHDSGIPSEEGSGDEDATLDIIDNLNFIPSDEVIRRHMRWIINVMEFEGKLEVRAVGDNTGQAEILLTQVSQRVYRVTFKPTKTDRYRISILLDGKHVSGSPIVFNYEVPETNISKINIGGWQRTTSLVALGKTVQFTVDARDAGLGELKVNPKTPTSTTDTYVLEVDESGESPNYFTVMYTPLIVGVHSLDLLFAGQPIQGSPLQLKAYDPSAIIFDYVSSTKLTIGQEIAMEVDTSKAGSDELTATCEGTTCGKVNVVISKTKVKGKFLISFKPLVQDVYILVVKLGGYEIRGSPFKFNLTTTQVERITVVGPEMPAGPGGPIKLVINTSGVSKGKLESYCKFKKQTVSVQVKEESPNIFSLVFKPEEPAKYVWYILYEGQNIPGSPFTIDTRPRPDKAVVVVPEHGSVRIGQYVTYEVDMSGAGIGTLTATCRELTRNKKCTVQITEIRSGVYHISFLLLFFGKYTLYVQWSGREIPDSPFEFDLNPPRPSDIKKLPIEIPFILPRIEDRSTLKYTCTGEKYGAVPISLNEVSANTYRIIFRPAGPDLYTISVLYNGVHVKGSPLVLDLRVPDDSTPPKDDDVIVPSDTTKPSSKPSEHNVTIGMAFIMDIKNNKREIKASATGKATGDAVVHVDQTPGKVTFNPKVADTYTLKIIIDDTERVFILYYTDPPANPAGVIINGLEELVSLIDVNKEVSFVINGMKGGSGTLRAEIRGPVATRVNIQPRDGQPGTYLISFVPTAPGVYILSLFWNGEHIPNSPLRIRIVDTSSANKIVPGGKFSSKDIEIRSDPTEIEAYAMRRGSTKKLKVTIEQIKTHFYRFIFSHNQPGFYFIHILVNGEELDFSPIPVVIPQQPLPKKIRVINFPTIGYINEQFSMTIDSKEGGEGTLDGRVIEPNKSESRLVIVDNRDGTFKITYTPMAEGTYTFYITWGGHAIGGPYQLVVRKPAQEELPISEVNVIDVLNRSRSFTGSNQLTLSLNYTFVFSIRLTKKQSRSFVARATGEDNKTYDFVLVTTEGNLHKYSFRPSTPGRFTLNFALGDMKLKLPQLPTILIFTETEVDAKQITVVRRSISGLLLVNRQILFQIDTRMAGNGKFVVDLEGPSSDTPDVRIAPTEGKPHFYDIFFTPVMAGIYRLKLLWSGTMIPGFPLSFNVVDTSVDHGDTPSFEVPIDSPAKDITSFAVHVKTSEKYQVVITQVSQRRYRFEFQPKQSGQYNLHILVGGKEIVGSPFLITYQYPPQPGNIIVKYPQNVKVNCEVKIMINTENAGKGRLNVRFGDPKPADELQLTEFITGVYRASFTPRTSGEYFVIVTWAGKEIPHSPFKITITDPTPTLPTIPIIPEPDIVIPDCGIPDHNIPPEIEVHPNIIESDLVIFGKTYIIGEVISFTIIHNGFPDRLNIRFTPDLGFKLIKGQTSNKYVIDTCLAGKFDMVILWDGKVISDAYSLMFELPKVIGGLSLQNQSFKVGRSYQFAVTTDDVSPGGMEITCEPHDAADIVCSAVTSTQFQCSLVPKTVGAASIIVSYNGYQIQGSPFLVNFISAAAYSCKFGLQSEGIEIRDIVAQLESIANQQAIPVSLQQLFGGECNLDFVPSDGDEYELTIKCGLKIKKEMMAGSPFKLSYVAGAVGGASMCRVEGVISGGVQGQWSKFVVNSKGAGSGKLTAEISGGAAELKIVSLPGCCKYEVNYRITAGGDYQLRVMWDGEDIPGSPIKFSVKSTSSSSTSTSISITKVPRSVVVQQPIEFELHIPHIKYDVTVEVTTSSGKTLRGILHPRQDGYQVSIPTSEAGTHTIAVLYQGKVLIQPFKVAVRAKGK